MVALSESVTVDRSGEIDAEFLPTRASLISRLRDWNNESWQEFFELYWKLIYNTARRYGLSDAEAQDVVQDTMIGVSRNIPTFRYDPERCAFKTWLMNLILWRIKDQVRRRSEHQVLDEALNIPEENAFVQQWEVDWERNLINAAIERVKNDVSPQVFQIFAFCVLQQKGVAKTAEVLNISKARVYLARHRVSHRIATEISRLKKQQNRPL
jgi:RNA polymerase sigma-70 factor (ECF subfamily)